MTHFARGVDPLLVPVFFSRVPFQLVRPLVGSVVRAGVIIVSPSESTIAVVALPDPGEKLVYSVSSCLASYILYLVLNCDVSS